MNVLKITADNPDELLATSAFGSGALIRVESSTDNVTFSALTTTALVAGQTLYTIYDTTGATGTYYRTRYSNSGGTNFSGYSDTFQANLVFTTYCSLYDVKQRLGITPTDTTDDENLLQFIDQASSWISGTTKRQFLPDPASGTTTYTYDGWDAVEDGRCLLIPEGIRSITTLAVATYTGGSTTTIASGDYFLRPTAQTRDPGWPATEVWISDVPSSSTTTPFFAPGFANISITGTFGWASTPSEIEDIALTLAVSAWRGRGSSGAETYSVGIDGERTFQRALSEDQRRSLRRYMQKPLVTV